MGGNFQKVGNSLDFFISETKHRIFNFSGPLRNFPSFGEIGGSGGVSMQCVYVWFVPMAAATVGAAAPRARTAFQMAAMLPCGPAGGVGSPWQHAKLG